MTSHTLKIGDRVKINKNSWGPWLNRHGIISGLNTAPESYYVDFTESIPDQGELPSSYAGSRAVPCDISVLDFVGPALTTESILNEYSIE